MDGEQKIAEIPGPVAVNQGLFYDDSQQNFCSQSGLNVGMALAIKSARGMFGESRWFPPIFDHNRNARLICSRLHPNRDMLATTYERTTCHEPFRRQFQL